MCRPPQATSGHSLYCSTWKTTLYPIPSLHLCPASPVSNFWSWIATSSRVRFRLRWQRTWRRWPSITSRTISWLGPSRRTRLPRHFLRLLLLGMQGCVETHFLPARIDDSGSLEELLHMLRFAARHEDVGRNGGRIKEGVAVSLGV